MVFLLLQARVFGLLGARSLDLEVVFVRRFLGDLEALAVLTLRERDERFDGKLRALDAAHQVLVLADGLPLVNHLSRGQIVLLI